MADLPTVEVPHPVGTIAFEQLRAIAESTSDSIAGSLLQNHGTWSDSSDGAEGGSCDSPIVIASEPDAMFAELARRGWTDGLPVLPPTRAAVAQMIAVCGMRPELALGAMPPLNGMATVEKIAANAVMAGCLPDFFPIVIAAVKAVLQPGFNLDGVQTTTGNVAPVMVVNGPCRKLLDINCGANALGPGWRANATIGRALRLIMTNIGGAIPGQLDKSTVGQPAKYSFCFGENEEQSPWEPLHIERGCLPTSDAVHLTGCSGVYSAVDMASQTAEGLLKTFALTMAGGLASGVTATEALLIICPEHAAIFSASGYGKAAIRQELFQMARVPQNKFSAENLELLSKRRPRWFHSAARGEIGAVDRPEDIWIVVAGGAGAKSAYIPGRTGTRLQTVEPAWRAGQEEES